MHKTSCADGVGGWETLWSVVAARFSLDESSDHGPGHWKRVERNGLCLAKETGADITVVRLFALFHDSRRENEFTDPEHGRRGAAYARELRDVLYSITDEQFDLLETACIWHTEATHHGDPTVGTCWDADRLDLGRVGIIPDPAYMSTAPGRELASIPETQLEKRHSRSASP